MEVLESKLAYIIAVTALTLVAILGGYFKLIARPNKILAPGSFGFPVIGESISFLRALKRNKIDEWFQDRIHKYGPVFRTSVMGNKAIVLTGKAGNRFIFSGNNNGLSTSQPSTLAKILGENSIFEFSGSQHRLLRSAIMCFLNPESLQRYVTQTDLILKQQIFQELNGKDSITIVPFIKKITFKVTCSLLFGIQDGKKQDELLEDFTQTLKGIYTIPLNFPGTTFYKAMQARARICKKLSDVMRTRKEETENGNLSNEENMISSFQNLRDENGDRFAEETILDNLITLIIASHDTITIVLWVFIRKLARSREVYDKVLEEQKQVLKASKERDGKLTWSEIQMMKYTWRVAQELMRISPPIFGNFRSVVSDTTFGGFDIPKGWKVFWVTAPTHMDGEIFEEPEKFDSSRFESASKSLIPPYAYIPFGAGPRICPGSEFARFEILLVIHHLVTSYTWTEMISDEPIICQPAPLPAMGLPVKLHPRQASSA